MIKIGIHQFSIKQLFCLTIYYSFARYLPKTGRFFNIGGHMRVYCAKNIFKYTGKGINIEKGAIFGRGTDIEIGDNSGIGINAHIPSDTIIGNNVMMGPNCYIFSNNHDFSSTSIPMIYQGFTERKQTIIGNDVWIGRNVTMTNGRIIKDGTIIGACCLLTKDFPEYSIVGGNPSKLIRSRLQ